MTFLLILCGFISLLTLQVFAQDFTVPSTWRKPTSNLTREARLSLIDGLFNTITLSYNQNSGLFNGVGVPESAHILHALSSFDYFNESTTNKGLVTNALHTMFSLVPNITATIDKVALRETPQQANSDAIYWGLAAMNAYRAYNDSSFIPYAEAMWVQGNAYMITPEDAAAGTHPMKNVSIHGTCFSATTAGGVFWISNQQNNTVVNGEATGSLFVLSARLYQHTGDTRYLDTMNLTLGFLLAQLYNGNIIMDTLDVGNCGLYATLIITQNSGWTIDGLTTLVAMNSSYTPFLSKLVSTVIPNAAWTNTSDGIIMEGPANAADAETAQFLFPLKGIYIRGLYERYRTIPPDSPEANLIRSHITVQFNALLDLASTPGSNQYSPRWEGPPPTRLLPYGQLAAADVLISALGFASEDNSTASTTPSGIAVAPIPTVPPSNNPAHSHDISKAIVGGTVGGVIFLLSLLAGILVLARKRAQRRDKIVELETYAQPYDMVEHTPGSVTQTGGVRPREVGRGKGGLLQEGYVPGAPLPVRTDFEPRVVAAAPNGAVREGAGDVDTARGGTPSESERHLRVAEGSRYPALAVLSTIEYGEQPPRYEQ